MTSSSSSPHIRISVLPRSDTDTESTHSPPDEEEEEEDSLVEEDEEPFSLRLTSRNRSWIRWPGSARRLHLKEGKKVKK